MSVPPAHQKACVAVVKCPTYDPEDLHPALQRSLDLIGGPASFLKPRTKVFVKINHLSPSSEPDKAVHTHPAFAREVLRLLLDLDLDITVGDDIQSGEVDGFKISGYRRVCAELGVRLINLKEAGFVETEIKGQVLKRAYVSRPVLESDWLVNLPKLKTHSLTIFTGAIKNIFGVIPYGLRLHYHRRFIRNTVFSQMLVDLYSCLPAQLTIMDAVVAMEGEGPGNGSPKKIGLILSSLDGVAVDAVATRLVGYNPLDIFTTFHAHRGGVGVGDIERIEILGESLAEVEIKTFKPSVVATRLFQKRLPSFLYAYFQDQLVLIPEVIPEKCTNCLECVRICPSRAMRPGWSEGKAPRVDETRCIHCLCCNEVCRYQAVRLKQLFLGKLIRRAESLYYRSGSILRKLSS